MAGIAYIRKRIFNPELVIDPDGVLPLGLKNTQIHKNNPVYYIHWQGTTQAGEELGTAAASVKDGTATAFQVVVVSDDNTEDKRAVAAGSVHSVCILGISVSSATAYSTSGEKPLVTAEVVRMLGTTDATSTRFYLWVDHAYACEWGTGGADAKGNITIEAPANTTLLTIAATYNETDGGVWHFPPNRRLYTHSVRIESTDALAAGAGVAVTNTCTSFDQVLNTDPDLDVDTYAMVAGGGDYREYHPINPLGRYTTVASKCLWSEALVVGAEPISIETIQYIDRGEL